MAYANDELMALLPHPLRAGIFEARAPQLHSRLTVNGGQFGVLGQQRPNHDDRSNDCDQSSYPDDQPPDHCAIVIEVC